MQAAEDLRRFCPFGWWEAIQRTVNCPDIFPRYSTSEPVICVRWKSHPCERHRCRACQHDASGRAVHCQLMADFSAPLPQAGGAAPADDAGATSASMCAKALDRNEWRSAFTRVKVLSRSFFDPREFSRPASQADWLERVSVNAAHFKMLYALIFLPVLVHTMLSSMSLRLGSCVLVVLWGYALRTTGPLNVFGLEVSAGQKLYVLVPVSVVIGLLTGMINALVYATVIFACVTMPHMSFHEPARLDALDALELQTLSEGS